jgi:hypothetical protein
MDCSLEEHSAYLQTLLFLRDTFHFDDFVGMAKNKRIHPAARDWNFQLTRTVIFDLRFADWCALFGALLNPVEDLLFTMVVKSGMLPSLSWSIQSMRECPLHRTSWAVECPRQRIGRNRNLVFPFCDITNRSNLLASELDLLESRVFAEDLVQTSWDAQFCEAWQEDLEW